MDFGDPVGRGQVGVVVGDQDGRGGPVAGEAGDQVDDGGAAFLVEGAGGFVDQEHGGVVHQGAGDVDALALAAGELVGAACGLVGQTDGIEQVHGPVPGRTGPAAVDPRHDLELFGGGEGGQEVGLLEDDADPAAAQAGEFAAGQGLGGRAVDRDGAGVGGDEGRGHREEAGLPAAGGADDGGQRALGDLKGDLVEGGQA